MVASARRRVVFIWEVGGGVAHIVPYIPLVHSLQCMGDEVVFILKDLSRVETIFGRYGVASLQAPTRTYSLSNPMKMPCTYAHILHNIGWSDTEALTGLVKAWRALFDLLRPFVVIFDHSPTALLAARGYGFNKILMGTGFTIPPDIYPLPNLRIGFQTDSERLCAGEDRIFGKAKRVLARLRLPALKRISELFSNDPHVLTTFKELDPYEGRENGSYWGTWSSAAGEDPMWPDRPGKRIFACLKPFPALPALLSMLNRLELPTLVHMDRVDRWTRDHFTSPTLWFVEGLLNMNALSKECDLAILNGTHHTSANLLLAGKPTLHLPLYPEQSLTARMVERLGAGIHAQGLSPEVVTSSLESLLGSDSHMEAAKAFSSRYREMHAGDHWKGLLDSLGALSAARTPMVRRVVMSSAGMI